MRLGLAQPNSDYDLLNLPRQASQTALDWRYLVNLGPTGKLQIEESPADSASGAMAWLKENQTIVITAAGALLLLALLGRRR